MKKFDKGKFSGKRKSGGDRPSFSDRPRSGGSSRGGFGGGSRGGSSFGGGDRFDRSGPAELFEAVCADCGNTCEVPFKPNGRKPVYCRDCFKKQGGSSFSDRPSPSFSDRPRSGGSDVSAQLSEINRKLDQILSSLNQD